jgi:hypothetical protein
VQHPIGTVKLDEVNRKAEMAYEQLVQILVEPGAQKVAAS